MKNRKKLWMKIGLALLAAGLVLGGAGLAMGGLDALKSTVDPRMGAYDADAVNAVRVEATSAEVRLERADGDQVQVTYFEGAYEGAEVTMEDGVLTVKQYDSRSWRDYIRFQWGNNREIVVRVPDELAGVDLSSTSGDVVLRDVPVVGEASLGSVSGKVEAAGSAGSLALSTTSGDIDAHDMQIAGDLKAGTTSGGIALSGLKVGGDLAATSTSGRIRVSETDAQSFTLGSVAGEIRLDGAAAASGEGAISATTTSGGIEVSDVSAAAFSFGSVSGDVKGTLPGDVRDYTIMTSTVSGGDSLPAESYGGRKTIDISTTSGDIELTFEE